MTQNIENSINSNCYICFDKVENIISVCKCNKVCHLKCLHQWITTSNSDTCDICKEKYIDLNRYFKISSETPRSVLITVVISIIINLIFLACISYIIVKHVSSIDALIICICGAIASSVYLMYQTIKYYIKNKKFIVRIINQFNNDPDINSTVVNIDNEQTNTSITLSESTPLI
jgi:E3 ubiquitin-protein ligase DOA10